MSKTKGLTAFGIASTYVGTVIGAGYASGQEILQFFSAFGNKGLFSLIVATLLFIIFAYTPMKLAKSVNSGDYENIISPNNSIIPKIFADILITFTMFGTLTIMIAASGTTFNNTFGWANIVGGVIMCILLIFSLFAGLDGIVKALSAIVPVMVTVAIGMGVYFFINPVPGAQSAAEVVINSSPLIKHWGLSGILYVAFNFVVAIAVLVSMGQVARSEKDIIKGSITGGLVLGICAMVLNFGLLKNAHIIGSSDLPMVELAGTLSSTWESIYSFILFLGLYSTAISCFYGVYLRFKKIDILNKLGDQAIILLISVISLSASMLGFTNLIGYVYPMIGYCGIIIMALTFYNLVKGKKSKETKEEFKREFVEDSN